ncbi:TonB-dependent receptor domain-containing protein [Coralloluteibacterium thermophilus]|uniref:TonB-dependent receptor domain-containing protein n=1 Tax=Coralloluteibacterium thermophilum TaxID=2707049 RepID=A0ABV9NJ25_9GAMM
MHHRLPAALIALACLPPAPLALATDAATLDRIVVTAARRAQTVDEALASVTLIERADIEASQAPDLIDLLGRQAGIDIARTGGPGSASTVFLRGGNSNHALVLVDGIRVASTNSGGFDFAHLPLEQIERIEIVRGPRAALWGSDAIGGVVHVFTRAPGQHARVHAGSHGRAGASAGFGIGDREHGFGITAGYDRLRGFSATHPGFGPGHDPDDDGYRNRSLGLQGRTRLGATHTLGAVLLATDADVEFDQGETRAEHRTGGLTLAGAPTAAWNHSLSIGQSRDDLSTPVYGSRFASRRESLDWVNTLAATPDQTVSAGLAWQHEHGASLDAFSGTVFDRSRRNAAGFLGWSGTFGAHRLEAFARHDDNGQFGGATTGSAAWGWQANERLRTRLSWGEGFRAPNFNELYYPDFGYGYAGNPDLAPERSRTVEAGADLLLPAGQRVSATAYRSRVDDLVAFAGEDFQAVNVARAEIDGVELDYAWRQGPWRLDANATWLRTEDAATGARLLRRAGRSAHASISRTVGAAFEFGFDLDHTGNRDDVSTRLGGFTLAHLRLAWRPAPAWTLQARIENLTDKDYAWAAGYATPGRSGLLSLRWTPQANR